MFTPSKVIFQKKKLQYKNSIESWRSGGYRQPTSSTAAFSAVPPLLPFLSRGVTAAIVQCVGRQLLGSL